MAPGDACLGDTGGETNTVVSVPDNRHYVAAEDTVAQVEAAFGARLDDYTIDGMSLRAPASALTIPSSLSGTVVGVIGIDQSAELMHPLSAGTGAGSDATPAPPAGFRNATPYSAYWGEKIATDQPEAYGGHVPYAVKGYTPAQFRGAYGVSSAIAAGNDGTGVTVAVIDAFAVAHHRAGRQPLLDGQRPAQAHAATTSSRSWRPASTSRAENKKQDPQGWWGEETLDIEAVHAMAPGAAIVYVGAPTATTGTWTRP